MKKAIRARNLPATVIAIIALVAAVGGMAIAGPASTSKKKKGLTPAKVKNIARNAVIKGSFVQTLDFSPLPAHTCETLFKTSPVKLASTDSIVVTPGNTSPPIGVVTQTVNNAGGVPGQVAGFAIEACNVTAAVIDPAPGPYRFTIIP
jgi:hypothetical protein